MVSICLADTTKSTIYLISSVPIIFLPYFLIEILIFSNKFLGPKVIGICKRRWHSEIVGAERECPGLSFVLFTVIVLVVYLEIIEQIRRHHWVPVLLSSSRVVYTCISRGICDLSPDLPCKLWTVPSSRDMVLFVLPRYGIDLVYIMEGTTERVQPIFYL